MVHLHRFSSLTVGPVWPKLPVPVPKIFVFSPTLLSSNQNFGRNANGSFRCDWKRYFNRTMLLHFVFITPLIKRVWFGKWKALIACDAGGPRTHSLDHWYSPSSLRIAHVRYIKILTWLRGFLVIFLHLVRFGFLCARVSSGNCETMESWKFATLTLKPRSHVRILKYRTWAISAQKLLCTNSQTLYTAVSYFLINQSNYRPLSY